jgi:hypothetical protein
LHDGFIADIQLNDGVTVVVFQTTLKPVRSGESRREESHNSNRGCLIGRGQPPSTVASGTSCPEARLVTAAHLGVMLDVPTKNITDANMYKIEILDQFAGDR